MVIFIHSTKHLWRSCLVPGIILGMANRALDKHPCVLGAYYLLARDNQAKR